MEEHVLQAVGKVAGIGGVALGVFLLLFREVIRKNIFPQLSDDEAYRLIRQFMYLTFGIALVGIVAWTYISVITTPTSGIHTTEKTADPSPDISGTWAADVKYSWGDIHQELFAFQIDGHAVSGTASYVTGANSLSDGVILGNRLSFQTFSYTEVEKKRYKEKHLYKGTVSGDTIDFILETDSGYTTVPPVKFIAHKQPAK